MNSPNQAKTAYDIGQEWATYNAQKLIASLKRFRIFQTGKLEGSISTTAHGNGTAFTKAIVEYVYYGKFVDMGVYRGHPLEDVKESRLEARALGTRVRRGPKKWYTKVMGPDTYALSNLLSEHYGNRAILNLKEDLPSTVNINIIP